MEQKSQDVDVPGIGVVPVSFTDQGAGAPALLLHGGAGPVSVAGFAELLAGSNRVITPVHPGFNGTIRPDGFTDMAQLAQLYGQLIADLDLTDVTVIGNSIGGWIAAELALLANPRVSRVVLVDAAGLALTATPTADFFSLTMDQVFDLAYYEPDKFRIDPAAMPEQQRAGMAANQAALRVYSGDGMADPSLLGRLPQIAAPTLVVWGAADRMVPPAHGQAFADAIPAARLAVIDEAGHLPQLETPERLRELVLEFMGQTS